MNILNKRASGILLHITSLPSEFGIGDLGKAAFDFADFLKSARQQYWQILPLNPTGASKNFSPYACYSAFAGNPLLISPVLLYEEGLIKTEHLVEISAAAAVTKEYVDYERASAVKNKIFKYAYNNFKKNSNATRDEFDNFCKENDVGWLEDFACFVAFKKYFKRRLNISSWSAWPQPIRDRSSCDIKGLKKIVYKEVELQKFLQFLFFKQWKNLKRHVNSNGISIFGDVPIYVDHESSDVWSHPFIFKLDGKKMPKFIAGVPPDYFSKTGQLWKNPVYDWEELKKTGFSWWIDRMKFNFDMFDLVRLDHFRGFIAYWEVPAKEKTAMNGWWVSSYPEEFFNLLSKKTGRLPIVAENLGVITPDVDAVMEKFGFPGLRVIQFAFGNDFPDSSYLPHNYIKNTVACTGTHDNNTLRGWLESEARSFEIKNLLKYLDEVSLPRQGHAAVKLKDTAAAADFKDTARTAGLDKDASATLTGFKGTVVAVTAGINKDAAQKNALKNNSRLTGRFEDIINKVTILLMASAANLVIIPMQDILGLGEKARMNRPSTSRGNWKWQMGRDMIPDKIAEKFSAITRIYKRC
jgi:4-alpha-glucanotransferase